jgi:lipopolysaccharide biosynthesis regulator YciM
LDEVDSRLALEQRLMSALETAQATNDQVGLARDSVELARLLLARDARPAAEVLLRKAVMVARRAKLPETHAEARIELAELARADGDLTSACEHWQMAKLMFHETGRRGDQDRMADVMRQNRCPTDWILTGF